MVITLRSQASADPISYDSVYALRNNLKKLNAFLKGKYSRRNGQLTNVAVTALEKLKAALSTEILKNALAQWIQEQEQKGTTVDDAIKALSTTSQPEVFAQGSDAET